MQVARSYHAVTTIRNPASYCTAFSCPATLPVKCDSSALCLAQSEVCNDTPDCPDGSDELSCPCSAENNKFECADRSACISRDWLCDGTPTCADGSDEDQQLACPDFTCPDYAPFRCGDTTQCIPQSWLCDGVNRCPDGSDEDPRHCPSNKFA